MCHFGEGMGSAESTEVLSVMVTKAWHGMASASHVIFCSHLLYPSVQRHGTWILMCVACICFPFLVLFEVITMLKGIISVREGNVWEWKA